MSDPLLFSLVQDLEFQTGYRIKQVVATRSDIVEAIQKWLSRQGADRASTAAAGGLAVQPQATRPRRDRRRPGRAGTGRSLARRLEEDVFEPVAGLKETQRGRADHRPGRPRREERHQEPRQRRAHRADGEGRPHPPSPRRPAQGGDGPAQVGPRGADRAPQDHGRDGHRREAAAAGRPHPRSTTEDGNEVDFRVSTLRTLFGEKVVLRVLDQRKGVPPLEELGISAAGARRARGCSCATSTG